MCSQAYEVADSLVVRPASFITLQHPCTSLHAINVHQERNTVCAAELGRLVVTQEIVAPQSREFVMKRWEDGHYITAIAGAGWQPSI